MSPVAFADLLLERQAVALEMSTVRVLNEGLANRRWIRPAVQGLSRGIVWTEQQ